MVHSSKAKTTQADRNYGHALASEDLFHEPMAWFRLVGSVSLSEWLKLHRSV